MLYLVKDSGTISNIAGHLITNLSVLFFGIGFYGNRFCYISNRISHMLFNVNNFVTDFITISNRTCY